MDFAKKVSHYFETDKFRTSLKTEILAGTTTFVAMAYIVAVNPAILSEAGIPFDAVLFATIVCSAFSCILMGLWANKPFALAPGMGMNGYVAYYVVKTLGVPWQTALGVVFFSGILSVILTLTPVRKLVIDSIPLSLKNGIAVGIGIFIAIVGVRTIGVLKYEGVTLTGVGNPFSLEVLLTVIGVVAMSLLYWRGIHAAVLIGMALVTTAAVLLKVISPPETFVTKPHDVLSAFLALDFLKALNPRLWPILIALLMIDFFSTVATFIGVTLNTNLLDERGHLPRLKEALLSDSVATPLGALFGTTSITTYIETEAGVQAGGRTGITALVVAAWLLPMLFFAPVVKIIPPSATAAALIFVGVLMMRPIKATTRYDIQEQIAFGVLVLGTAGSFSIDQGMLYGFLTFILLKVLAGKRKNISVVLYITTAILLFGRVIQFF